MFYPFARLCFVVLWASGLLDAQVVFSRRVYTDRGRSWQQLWMWNPADGKMKLLTHSARNHFEPSCTIRRGVIFFHAGDEPYDERQMWSFNLASGAERQAGAKPAPPEPRKVPIVGCESSAWTGDHARGACAVGQSIVFYDAGQGAISGRVRFAPRSTPPEILGWSLNGKWLLVRTMGENDNSTSRQSDYFVLNTPGNTWIPVGSGNDALWVPGKNEVLYSSPRELKRLRGSRHEVWTAQLVTFDPATGKRKEITGGMTNNIQPAVCVNANR